MCNARSCYSSPKVIFHATGRKLNVLIRSICCGELPPENEVTNHAKVTNKVLVCHFCNKSDKQAGLPWGFGFGVSSQNPLILAIFDQETRVTTWGGGEEMGDWCFESGK